MMLEKLSDNEIHKLLRENSKKKHWEKRYQRGHLERLRRLHNEHRNKD